jgi:hypothetical protein
MIYLTQITHGNGDIEYVPTIYGELLRVYRTDRLRKLNLSFGRKKTYKLRLLTYNVYDDDVSILIHSHLIPNKDDSYEFRLY